MRFALTLLATADGREEASRGGHGAAGPGPCPIDIRGVLPHNHAVLVGRPPLPGVRKRAQSVSMKAPPNGAHWRHRFHDRLGSVSLTTAFILGQSLTGALFCCSAGQSGSRPRVRRFRPVLFLLGLTSRVAPGLRPRVQKVLIKQAYQVMSRKRYLDEVNFMNYGYAPDDASSLRPPPSLEERAEGFGIHLYRKVAGAVDLSEKDTLEVGCGRGGGSAFIASNLRPRTMTGVDFAHSAVAVARARHTLVGLRFVTADAEHLPFYACSFDAVVNVESSHCYPDLQRFLKEVHRVLRPGGSFLFADFRAPDDLVELREQLGLAGLVLREEECITPNVVLALRLDTGRRLAIIQRTVPRLLQSAARDFFGVEGSEVFEHLREGKLEYVRMVALRDRSGQSAF